MSKPKIDLDSLVSGPGFAPRAWQAKCPDEMYDGGHKIPVSGSPDLTRIVALPRRTPPVEGTPEANQLVAFMSARYRRENNACRCREFDRDCIKELRLIQAWSLLEIETQSGLLGPIGVGHGKTILDLLAALAMPNCRTAVLLVPPSLTSQLWSDYQLIGQHFRMPSIQIHDKDRHSTIVPGTPVLHVFPYSKLNRPESTATLEQDLKPDLIIADEVHKLKAANTATTSRVLRYFRDHPNTRFCGWSGSMTDKSIKEYAHLGALALRHQSPLPIDPETAEDWARAIDPSDAPAPEGALIVLCNPGEHIHSAFHRRLVESPGVVATTTASIDARLEIVERAAPPLPNVPTLFEKSVAQALSMVRNEWKRPDGMDIPDALQKNRCAMEIACGFFNRWRYPHVQGKPQNVATIINWLAVRSEWNCEVRAAIRSRQEHFDSELLARNAAERFHGDRPIHDKSLPVWGSKTYPRWKAVENDVVYESEAIWLDDFLAQDAAEWGLTHRGIIWYAQNPFGERVADLSGLNLHRGGPEAGKLIALETGERSIIASIKSHGTGRDGLQHKFFDQLIANFPSSNNECEQLLGRLHRIGQKSDVVQAAFYRHTDELRRATNQALRRAGYVQGTIGSTQKLNLSGLLSVDEEEDEY